MTSHRQLRLWEDHGQAALESSHVCLIHVTALGTETLKNLVLPGIGVFTIVDNPRDNHTVKPVNLGSNYSSSQLTHWSRGLCAAELLQELNTEVCSNHIDESLDMVLNEQPWLFQEIQCCHCH